MKALVVYYSRTGMTRNVAKAIAEKISGDLEEIIDSEKRSGPLGFLRSLKEAMKGEAADIENPIKDPSSYDLVIIGTPIWANNMSTPVRAYLSMSKGRIGNVAFFCTFRNLGGNAALRQMEKYVGKKPIVAMSFKEKDVKNGSYLAGIGKFMDGITI